MGFLVSVMLFLIVDGFVLWYLTNSEYFEPFSTLGEIDVWNIGVFVFLLSVGVGLLVALLVFILEKLFYCGRNEFPRPMRAIRYGLLVMFCVVVGLFLHIFHFLNFGILLVLFFLAIVGIVLVR
jgi:hypothetical protein